jgi:hypothetical protein
MSPFAFPQGSGSTGSTESGADSEHEGGAKRHQRKQDRRPGHQRGHATGNEGRDRRMDRVYEPKAAADETSREDEPGYSRGQRYK